MDARTGAPIDVPTGAPTGVPVNASDSGSQVMNAR